MVLIRPLGEILRNSMVFTKVWKNFHHSINPCERGEMTCCLVADPVTNFEVGGERS